VQVLGALMPVLLVLMRQAMWTAWMPPQGMLQEVQLAVVLVAVAVAPAAAVVLACWPVVALLRPSGALPGCLPGHWGLLLLLLLLLLRAAGLARAMLQSVVLPCLRYPLCATGTEAGQGGVQAAGWQQQLLLLLLQRVLQVLAWQVLMAGQPAARC
jgi:hypothetical protein